MTQQRKAPWLAAYSRTGLHSGRIAPDGNARYSFLSLTELTHDAYGACQRCGDEI